MNSIIIENVWFFFLMMLLDNLNIHVTWSVLEFSC